MPDEKNGKENGDEKPARPKFDPKPTKRGAPIPKTVRRMPQRARKDPQAKGKQGKHQ
jgi:hypothetical protein